MWTIYLCGWLIMSVAAVVAADAFHDSHASLPHARGAVAVTAGALWPVLLIGIVQAACVVCLARWMRTAEYARR